MKEKLLMMFLVLTCVLAFSGLGIAAEFPTLPASGTPAFVVAQVSTAPATQPVTSQGEASTSAQPATQAAAGDTINIPGLNLSGDTGFLVRAQKLGAGFGTDLACWKDCLVSLRGEVIAPTDGKNLFGGAGPMLDIPKTIGLLGGGTWVNKTFTCKAGFMGGYDFIQSRFDGALVFSIIKVF